MNLGRYKTIKFRYFVIVIALYSFVLQNYVQFNYFQGFGYVDEIIALGFGGFFLISVAQRKKISEFEWKIIACFSIIIFLAIISTLLYTNQPFKNEILDLYANIKFVSTILGAKELYKEFDFTKYVKKLYFHLRIIIIILMGLTIFDLLFDLFPEPNHYYYKYGIKPLSLIYGHPAILSVICLLLFAILIFLNAYNIKSAYYKMMLVLMMILTLRAKIIGTLAVMCLLSIYVLKFKGKITIPMLLSASPFAVVFAWKELQSYYLANSQASRLLLTVTSLKMAKDLFPLGSGLASFGSAFSLKPYSIIYKMYGLSEIWGLSAETGQDVTDTFWPMILGQFGIIALIVYLVFVYNIFKQIQKLQKKNIYFYLASWCIFIYLIIGSTSESAFVNSYAVFLGIFLSLFLNVEDERK